MGEGGGGQQSAQNFLHAAVQDKSVAASGPPMILKGVFDNTPIQVSA